MSKFFVCKTIFVLTRTELWAHQILLKYVHGSQMSHEPQRFFTGDYCLGTFLTSAWMDSWWGARSVALFNLILGFERLKYIFQHITVFRKKSHTYPALMMIRFGSSNGFASIEWLVNETKSAASLGQCLTSLCLQFHYIIYAEKECLYQQILNNTLQKN